ncbi:MAG: hypothetical protein V2A74_04585 [bacterium]
MTRSALVLIFSLLSFFALAQTTPPAPLFPGMLGEEAEVSPPPPGEWIKHMPSGYRLEALPSHSVRALYLIPSNRTAQPQAVERMQYLLLLCQDWYRDEMERLGFGLTTFNLETEADGVTPKIYIVNAPNTDDYYRVDPWTRVSTAAQNAGLPIWSSGQVWIEIHEAHVMNSDGSITGGFNGGASYGSGSDGGVGMTVGSTLALVRPEYLTDDRSYDGLTISELGPYPMRNGVTCAWFDGTTISSISSVCHGIVLHEGSHGFGLHHDFRNDLNFDGNMEGNGFRGVRGWTHPELYSDDETRLTYADALALSVNRYFRPSGTTFTDNTRPTGAVVTSGNVTPVNGLVEIRFTASDAGGLAAALLRLDGNTVGEMALSGTSVDQTFATTWYTPGQNNNYSIRLFDAQANRQDISTTINPASGFNRAPQPFIQAKPSKTAVNSPLVLDASRSYDPDHSVALLVAEWDLDGDGTFDTAPTTNLTYIATFSSAGTRKVCARITDPAGAQSISAPIGIRITAPTTAAHTRWTLYE